MTTLRRLDLELYQSVNRFAVRTPWLHQSMAAYADIAVGLFAIALLTGVWLSRHRTDRELAASIWAGCAVLLAVALNQPLGNLVHEARPYTSHPGVLVLVARTGDFAFPSDHAVMAGAATAGLLLVGRRIGLVVVAIGVLLSIERVYVGAHYPWDVLAGLTFGVLVALIGWVVVGGLLTWLVGRLRTLPWARRLLGPRAAMAAPAPTVAVGAHRRRPLSESTGRCEGGAPVAADRDR